MVFDMELIKTILLCAGIGLVGQLFRSMVGIYKVICDEANVDKSLGELMDYRRLIISLIIGLFIGGLASFAFSAKLSKADIVTLISIGYAGTDGIEGLFITAGAKKKII